MKITTYILVIMSLVVLPLQSKAGVVASNDASVLQIAEPILDDIMNGMQNDDVKLFSKHFGIRMSRWGNRQTMNEWHENMLGNCGSYQSRSYMGFLNQDSHTLVMWKAKYSNTKDDIALMLYLQKIEGIVVVTSFNLKYELWPTR